VRRERIEAALAEALQPERIEVIDESAKHHGHAGARPGGETHYHVRMVAEGFAGQSRVARQRMVNALLKAEFETGLHALSLDLKTPAEAG